MSGFTFLWSWAIGATIAIACLVLIPLFLSTRRAKLTDEPGPRVWDMHSVVEHINAESFHRYRRTAIAGVCSLCVAAAGSLVLVSRPAHTATTSVSRHSRDIILCLDVSGSALPFDRQVMAAYRELVTHFRTERIGMSIFNSTSRTVFPLTNDYRLVKNQLDHAVSVLSKVTDQKSIDSMSQKDYQAVSDWLEGTQNRHDATSLIGDGLVGCETMLPNFTVTAKKKQARLAPASIVFATDNMLSGTPIYTLQKALQLATLNSITVDALYTGPVSSTSSAQATSLRTQIAANNGTFRTQADADSVAALVSSIENQQVKAAQHESSVQADDWPWPFAAFITFFFLLGLILLAKVKR